MKIVDHAGKRFGSLVVQCLDGVGKTGHKNWKCLCDCGSYVSCRGTSLTQGHIVSCGCKKEALGRVSMTKHGLYYHPSYSAWQRMMTRCHNINSKDYAQYGGRGISVCARWHDVANFIEDMGVRPANSSIDRVDNSRGYEIGNCRWSNPTEQANNTRRNVHVLFDSRTMTLAQVARKTCVSYKALYYQTSTKGLSADAAVRFLKERR